jgi:hypothetical protein
MASTLKPIVGMRNFGAPATQNSERIDDRSKGLNRWLNQERSP